MEEWAGHLQVRTTGACWPSTLAGIAVYLFWPSQPERLEEPARRMLEEDDR